MKYRTLILSAIVVISLAVTAAVIITDPKQTSYLQDPYQIYTMEAGILKQNLPIRDGEDILITYSFNEPGFQNLLKKYSIEKTAGSGSSLHRALTYSHGQAHGNPAMVTTAASRRMSYTVSGPRDPSVLALWFRRPSPVPFGS